MDLRDLQLEEATQEALMRPADEDLRAPRGTPDLEHVRLHRLADAVVLERALLAGGEDRLDPLADVEDDRARLDPAHGSGQQVAFAARELVEDLVALHFADALQDDLLRGLRADAAEVLTVELLGLDQVAGLRVRLDLARLVEAELRELVLDLGHGVARPEHADGTALGIDLDVDVLLARDAAICSLDALLQGTYQDLS